MDRMQLRLKAKALEEVDCLQYLGSQVAAVEGCGTLKE